MAIALWLQHVGVTGMGTMHGLKAELQFPAIQPKSLWCCPQQGWGVPKCYSYAEFLLPLIRKKFTPLLSSYAL